MWKHCLIHPEGRQVNFKMDALRPLKFPMVRQVNKGDRVRLTKAEIFKNSKYEFHQPGIVRIITVKGNVNDEQMGVFALDGGGAGTRGRGRGRNIGMRKDSRGRGTRSGRL